MEERNDAQLDMLAKIHNQLVDLKRIMVEIELARPGTSQSLQTRLRQIVGNDQHVDAAGQLGALAQKERKVIAPGDNNIQPGEGRD
ncbi:MAG TPA: hypothetical protein VGH44_01460 [Candidatus Saccharimonadia bacterium]|jgi:hypothetical protein